MKIPRISRSIGYFVAYLSDIFFFWIFHRIFRYVYFLARVVSYVPPFHVIFIRWVMWENLLLNRYPATIFESDVSRIIHITSLNPFDVFFFDIRMFVEWICVEFVLHNQEEIKIMWMKSMTRIKTQWSMYSKERRERHRDGKKLTIAIQNDHKWNVNHSKIYDEIYTYWQWWFHVFFITFIAGNNLSIHWNHFVTTMRNFTNFF